MANKKFLNPINLVNLSSDPGSANEGDIYYNTTDDVVKVYANGAWVAIGAGGGSEITVSTTAPSSPVTGDAWYKNDTGELYIYDGSFWVEVNGTISLTQEQVQDYVAPLFTHSNHTNASVTYEDASNELHIDVINAPSADYTAVLKHDVRLNGSIAKGQAVYVSSSNGTNMVVSKASSASEATSSKTLGLLETGGTDNALVKVVTEGLLAGLDTSTAGTEGDPVWLGTDGNLIYGLLNKPVAPAHLVFIGVVTRKNSNNGEIFVKVQNGFELKEIHDVLIDGTPADDEILAYDSESDLWINQTAIELGLATVSQLGDYQPIDPDLTAIAGLTGTSGLLKKTASDTWTLDTTTYATAGDISSAVGDYIPLSQKGDPQGVAELDIDGFVPESQIPDLSLTYLTPTNAASTYQGLDADLTAIAGLTGTSGLLKKTNTDTWALDTETYLSTTDAASTYQPIGSYSEDTHNHTLDSLSNVVITGTPTDGQAIVWDTTTSKWVNETVAAGDAFPTQTGNDGKFLQTDGTDVSWQNVNLTGYVTLDGVETLSNKTLFGDILFVDSAPEETYFSIWHDFENSKATLQTSLGLAIYAGGGDLSLTAGTGDIYINPDNVLYVTNPTTSSSSTTGAIVVTGGVGIGEDLYVNNDVWIDGDLHVNGTTSTLFTSTVSTHDNMLYLNAAIDTDITNAVGDGTYVTYTANNTYTPGMDIRVTGMDPSGYNISSGDALTIYSATSTQFVVAKTTTGSFVSGGVAHAKTESNADLGFAGGYYSSGYAHAGLFRDATDGVFKFFDGYTPEPDEAVDINTGHASFSLADISAANAVFTSDVQVNGQINLVMDGATPTSYLNGSYNPFTESSYTTLLGGTVSIETPTVGDQSSRVFLEIGGASLQALGTGSKVVITGADGEYLNSVDPANQIATIGDLTIANVTDGTPVGYAYGGTGLSTLGTAGQVLKVNSAEDALEWGTVSGGGSGNTALTISSTPPSSPSANDMWQDLDTGRTYVYDGTYWVEIQSNGSLGMLRYLGASATAPTASIDGSALSVGEVYFDTVFNGMKVWDGDSWNDAFSAASLSVNRWKKTATGGETSLSGSDDNSITLSYVAGIESVFLNGVKLIRGSDYTATDGSNITGLTALTAGSVVEVISYTGFTVANTYTIAQVDALLSNVASFNSTITVTGNVNPASNNAYDLGTGSLRWRNVYTQDLHLSNGIGDYTVIEGEEDLFLVNNKSGKSFKFALIEVDPSVVPPKSESN